MPAASILALVLPDADVLGKLQTTQSLVAGLTGRISAPDQEITAHATSLGKDIRGCIEKYEALGKDTA